MKKYEIYSIYEVGTEWKPTKKKGWALLTEKGKRITPVFKTNSELKKWRKLK